ncbi:MAG TPA: hypothetical protein EYN66_04050 [Myxococcales bacterium]|nr:hypothetical protein [Myxococcales bacterium]
MQRYGILIALTTSAMFGLVACSSGGGSGNTDDGACQPEAGQCSNICESGSLVKDDSCVSDAECGCGLSCQPAKNACPNFGSEGTGIFLEACTGPSDCKCGLYCDQGLCSDYKGEFTDCVCSGKQCLPMTGDEAGCSCGVTNGCVPNQQIECACPGGVKGIQSCNADGSGFEPCQCETGTTDQGTTDEGSTTGEVCQEKVSKKCKGSGFVWVDSCGVEAGSVSPCPANTTCKNNGCVADDICEPKVKKLCFEHNVYFYDSCNNKQAVTIICKDEEFCKGCTVGTEGSGCETKPFCVKADLSGDWLLKVKPGSSSACTSYPPQTLALLIDGTTATGAIGVGNIQAKFNGTITGKKLKIEATYQPLAGFDSTEIIEGTFLSPSTFDGTVYVEQSTSGIPICQAVFEVTGQKK